jgi:uncharacterized protein (TIGR02594 family)
MSDTADTADGTIKVWLAAAGFICLFIGVELIVLNGSIAAGAMLIALSVALYWAQYKWPWLKTTIHPHILDTLNRIVTEARWWFGLLGLILLAAIFSPYVEQHRIPYAWLMPAKNLGSDPPWITVALKEYEQARLIAPNNNPRILEYLRSIPGGENLSDKVDWASAFAEWTLNQVGISGPKNLTAKAWVRWGRGVKEPQKGAVAIFNFDGTEHVAFFLADAGDDLIVLGGNQEQKVQARRYPKSKLITYRMPPLPEANGNSN